MSCPEGKVEPPHGSGHVFLGLPAPAALFNTSGIIIIISWLCLLEPFQVHSKVEYKD